MTEDAVKTISSPVTTCNRRINSKQKGNRGERSWRDKLREQGFLKAYRSQQYCGSNNSADVICPELPNIHFEVKYTERLKPYEALAQAANDCSDKVPIVAHRRNNCEWMVLMRADDWFDMIKETEHVKTVCCPDCGTTKTSKNGYNDKIKTKYLCLNDECKRYSFVVD